MSFDSRLTSWAQNHMIVFFVSWHDNHAWRKIKDKVLSLSNYIFPLIYQSENKYLYSEKTEQQAIGVLMGDL